MKIIKNNFIAENFFAVQIYNALSKDWFRFLHFSTPTNNFFK